MIRKTMIAIVAAGILITLTAIRQLNEKEQIYR